MPKRSPPMFLFLCGMAVMLATTAPAKAALSPIEDLGKKLFFDASLSSPTGQSCADCHAPEAGWTGPDSVTNSLEAIYHGVIPTRSGNRKPPTSAYAGSTPILHKFMGGGGMGGGGMGGGGMGRIMVDRTFAGGMFWDGRATGWSIGDPLAEQAMAPFLNPLEQNNTNQQAVCLSVLQTDYTTLFEEVWGQGSLDCAHDVSGSYERIVRSIAAYERSAEVNPYSSKFDLFWQNSAGKMPLVQNINAMNWTQFKGRGLTDMELQGLVVFNTKGKCSSCHWITPGPGNTPPLFLNFAYHNLGVPKNPLNPFYDMPPEWNPDGENWVDLGLGGFLATTANMIDLNGISRDYTADVAANLGRHRTPTLRNIDKRPSPGFVKAYGHNGYFKSIMEIVHFYNTRDTLPVCSGSGVPGMTCWPAAEVQENVNTTELGNLGLTPPEGMALIKFLETLSDGYQDSLSKVGVFRAGSWFLDANGTMAWDLGDTTSSFGISTDVPVAGDWDGTGGSSIGVYRGGTWYLDLNGDGTWDEALDKIHTFGIPGDRPVVGDWNGSGMTKIGTFRSGQWFFDLNGNGVWEDGIDTSAVFGIQGDIPITGDWTGSGTTKIGVVRGTSWYLDMNGNGVWDSATDAKYSFGNTGDVPITGDWTGSGTTKIGVVRGSAWFLDTNGNGAWNDGIDAAIPDFGIPGDLPVTGTW